MFWMTQTFWGFSNMGQPKLETYFWNANQEYERIVSDLKNRFNPNVYEEIIAFVQMKTDEAKESVWKKLSPRHEELDRLAGAMPNKPKKEEVDSFIQNFFRLADPGKVSTDLQQALRFNQLEKEYKNFIEQMSTGEYGEIFLRYQYPSAFFQQLIHSVLQDIDMLTRALEGYTNAIGKHAVLIDTVKSENEGKAFIKGGASLLGLLVGIPFAGAGVGALMGGNGKEKINESLQGVFESWDDYTDQFNAYLKLLWDNYRLAVMTLYGGTLLRVNDQLSVQRFTFLDMALSSGDYLLTITAEEKKETEQWVKETIAGIEQLMKQEQWQKAIMVAKKFLYTIRQRPVTARTELYDGKSTLYIAHMYFYLVFQEALLKEYKNGHVDNFYKTAKQLYEEMSLLVQDSDIAADFSKTGSLLFRFVKEAVKRGKYDELHVIVQYLTRVFSRAEKEGLYIGERTAPFQKEIKAFMIVEYYIKVKTRRSGSKVEKPAKLSIKQLKELIILDEEIGKPDEFTKFLKTQYLQAILLPWQGVSFDWIPKYKKKITAVLVGGLLVTGGITYGEELYDYSKDKLQRIDFLNQRTAESITYFTITKEYANVRVAPSLQEEIAGIVSQSVDLQYLNEEQTDADGRVWFLVTFADGEEGWISSEIIEELE